MVTLNYGTNIVDVALTPIGIGVIAMGSDAIVRDNEWPLSGRSTLDLRIPCNGNGLITEVRLRLSDVTVGPFANVHVGAFYHVVDTAWGCRDFDIIPQVDHSGGVEEIVTLPNGFQAMAGDIIGAYVPGTQCYIMIDTDYGNPSMLFYLGNAFAAGQETAFTLSTNRGAVSMQGVGIAL